MSSYRVQRWVVYVGLVFPVLLFGGLLMAGMLPPPSPSWSAERVKAWYEEHNALKLAGFNLFMIGGGMTGLITAIVSTHIQRVPGAGVLSRLQLLGGAAGMVAIIVPSMLFMAAAFDPGRPAEITKALHELAFVPFVMNWAPAAVQLGAVGVAALMPAAAGIWPRWFGFYSLWTALCFVPGSLLPFFKSGALAWNGAVNFWIVAVLFGTWFVVASIVMLRMIGEQERADVEAAGRTSPRVEVPA